MRHGHAGAVTEAPLVRTPIRVDDANGLGPDAGRKHRLEENKMKGTLTFLTVGASFLLPLAASAQTPADVAYCKKLSAVYRAYNEGSDPATSIATALTKCNSAPAASIPVLEKALKDDGFTLPKKM
jgi:hypothetical protein